MMNPDHKILSLEISVSGRDDGTLEAMYIRIQEGDVAETREIDGDGMVADYDSNGDLIGVEVFKPVKLSELEKLVDAGSRPTFSRFVRNAAPRNLVTC